MFPTKGSAVRIASVELDLDRQGIRCGLQTATGDGLVNVVDVVGIANMILGIRTCSQV